MADLSSLLGAAGIGGAIGKAVVSLELSTSKYLSEMKAAEGQTVASTNAMGSSTSKLSSIASTAFLGIGVAAVAGLAMSVKAAVEAQAAHTKLVNTFENQKMLADSSVQAFEAQADALRDLTGVDDEAIIGAQALLGQFKLTGEQVTQLIPKVVDLSAKMGIDLEAAAKAVGKATQGSAGVLARYGIVLDKDKLAADAFGTTLHGLGVAAGFAEQRAKDEPWRLIGAQFEEIAETIGKKLLPVIQDLAQTLADNMPTVEAFGTALQRVIDIFSNIEQISFAPWTVLGDSVKVAGGRIGELDLKLPELEKHLGEMQQKADMTTAGINNLTGSLDLSRISAVSAGTEWKGLSKTGKEIADGLKQDLPEIIGTVTKWKDVFTLSPGDLKTITDTWVKIGKTMLADLRELAESDLKPAMKEAIAALPPEMRHAWAEGNAKEKGAIEASIRQAYNIKDELDKIANDAAGAARGVGRNIASGIALGITTSSELITVAAAGAVHRAIEAAKAAGKIHSPSEEMMKVGAELAKGLEQGILKNTQKVIDATKSMLEKVIGAASSFRSGISGGIGGFGNLGAAFGAGDIPLSEVIATQVSGASQLASILKALKAQGASRGLLSQVAESGAGFGQALLDSGQVAEANQAILDIAEMSKLTGKALSEAFFGDRIDKLQNKLEQNNEELRDINRAIRDLEHGHDVVLDGEKITINVRQHLIRDGSRNPDIFGGRA